MLTNWPERSSTCSFLSQACTACCARSGSDATYRLEMGTRLAAASRANLYQFWAYRIAEHLNAQLADRAPRGGEPGLVKGIFKAVERKVLRARVVECVFEDPKGGTTKSSASTPSARARAHGTLGHSAARPGTAANCKA